MNSERSWDELVELNERQQYGEAWLPDREPDHPTTLVGTVRAYDQGPTSEFTGEQPWICAVEDRQGKLWSVWLNRAVLISEFEKQRPMPDERVVIRYRGRQEEPGRPGAAPAHLYTVTVDREQQLPAFLTRPRLEEGDGERRRDLQVDPAVSDIPADAAGFTYGQPPPVVSDAEVVEENDDDDPPF